MRRREFITLLGGATASWPLAASAHQRDRMRRIALLLRAAENDRDEQDNLDALREHLAKLGWVEGRNLRIELRWGARDVERMRAAALELSSLAADVFVTSSGAATRAAQRATQTVPIVFTGA